MILINNYMKMNTRNFKKGTFDFSDKISGLT